MEPFLAFRNSRQSRLFISRTWTWKRRDLFDLTLKKCEIVFLEFILMAEISFFKVPQSKIEDTGILGVEKLGSSPGDSWLSVIEPSDL